jgi:hypothetical protein
MSEKLNRVTVIARDQVRGQPVSVVVALTSDGIARTRVRGRAAIVVEFQPKPGVAPREGSIERLTSSMSGTL